MKSNVIIILIVITFIVMIISGSFAIKNTFDNASYGVIFDSQRQMITKYVDQGIEDRRKFGAYIAEIETEAIFMHIKIDSLIKTCDSLQGR